MLSDDHYLNGPPIMGKNSCPVGREGDDLAYCVYISPSHLNHTEPLFSNFLSTLLSLLHNPCLETSQSVAADRS